MKRFLPLLFIEAFLLNFIWETTQMPLYLSAGMGEREDFSAFLGIHWRVSVLDAVTVAAAYLLVGLIMRNLRWGSSNNKHAWSFFVAGLLVWQIIVEYLAVYIYHRWAYAPAMPLVFGIGISPLIQMVALGPLAVFLARNLGRK